MIGFVRRIWRGAPWATALAGFALLVALLFAVRLALFTLHWSDPASRDQAIAGWMTPGYVAMSWQVPPEVVADALTLTPDIRRRASLDMLAERSGVPLDVLNSRIDAAIATFRQAQADRRQ